MPQRLILIAFCLGWPALLFGQTAARTAFVTRVSQQLAYVGQLKCELVGRAPVTPRQFIRFDSLRRYCSNAELHALLQHRSPVVRSYALWALSERPDADLLPLLRQHRRDRATFEAQCGCIGTTRNVVDFMLQRYRATPQYRVDTLVRANKVLLTHLERQSAARTLRWLHAQRQLSWPQKRRHIRRYQQLAARDDD
ncbi:hypothetical protein EJV47_07025 [Hymenobacter gummosus]|uniref:HEAT repeat domain-containing protein n=1 Tax=Hymenobacter gummosus TaxID=1776032 RepID=A0A431U5F1_9BACT|nr:hypothetical protein [Hymenobacter gummosus]RTQ51544.1 hypothetical protein EJV47_07025 [Hymenobacter gummosus]